MYTYIILSLYCVTCAYMNSNLYFLKKKEDAKNFKEGLHRSG